MSDLSAAAAAALGIPEAIVMRSAAARATETGMTVDEVLAAWAGGGSIDAPASVGEAPTGPATQADSSAPEVASPEEAMPPSVGETPTGPPAAQGDNPAPSPATPPSVARTASGKPPILVGEPDRPMIVLAGVIGLFVAVLLVGLVGPSAATENPGARTSVISYSAAGIQGQEIYESLGCGSCHTQMVRPIVSDVGLGAVTLNDSNQVLGTRRIGPDLSDVGSRLAGSQIEAIVTGFGNHPGVALSSSDLEDLVTYLLESKTSAPPAEDEE
jgi:Cytochrome C oxidase, mono-heme subunit/FixO